MMKWELLDEIDRLYDKIADRDQTIEDLEKRVEELELDLCRAVQWKEDLLNTCDEKDEIIRQYEGEFDGLGKRVEELEDYIRQHVGVTWPAGYRRITDKQIDAAVERVREIEMSDRPWSAWDVINPLGIIQDGHGWVVKDE